MEWTPLFVISTPVWHVLKNRDCTRPKQGSLNDQKQKCCAVNSFTSMGPQRGTKGDQAGGTKLQDRGLSFNQQTATISLHLTRLTIAFGAMLFFLDALEANLNFYLWVFSPNNSRQAAECNKLDSKKSMQIVFSRIDR
jgi:hypothetical protein